VPELLIGFVLARWLFSASEGLGFEVSYLAKGHRWSKNGWLDLLNAWMDG